MKEPRVSVIIPTFNSAEYIEEALESVFEQTFQDFEIIVVDDGSTDETGEVLKKYGDRIRYIYQENNGPAGARNRGIRVARGEYIAFLDADDLWVSTKLEKQVDLFRQRKDLGMVTTGACSFDEKGVFGYSADKRETLMAGDIARNIFLRSNIGTPTVMVRKEVFDSIGYFEENIRQSEDDNMWIRIASHYDVELIDEALIKVRNHPRRMTLNKSELLDSVQTSIRLLMTKYGDVVKRKVEGAVPIKLSQVQFSIGYGYYESGDYSEARKAFIRGARYRIRTWKNLLYLMFTFIPPGLAASLKTLRRKIAPIRTEGVERKR